MAHIPTEILHLIFIQLLLEDRLECLHVCQFWYNTLDKRSLLHTLHISNGQFQRLKDMLERLSYRGTQVEKLDVYLDPAFDKRKLCNMFPNLRELILKSGSRESTPDQNYLNTKFYFIYPATKLETISDFGHCELACQLATSNLCRHIKFLYLNFSHLSDPTIISQLRNMPVMEALQLIKVKLKLMDLEILHSNLGSIKYLNLDELDLFSGEMPQNVTPATLVTKLEYYIENVADLHTHIQFYKYMYKKYPLVSHSEGYDFVIRKENEDYVKEVYTKGIIPLYQNIGSQIDTFRFDTYCSDLDAFRKFDEYGFKLKDLQIKVPDDNDDSVFFLEQLAQSDQAKYIEYLHLENIVPLPLVKLKRMETLHDLKIDCYDWCPHFQYQHKKTINFCQFIEACPATLFKLVIVGVGFTFSNSPLNLTYINHLELAYVELARDLAKIIETHFPELSTLILMGTLKSNLEISLPNHNLETVSISTRYINGPWHGFLIRTTKDDNLQYHMQREIPNETKSSIYRAIPVTKEEFDAPLVLNFTSASVRELILTFH